MKILILIIATILLTKNAKADGMGVATIGLTAPQYMGADENYNLVFPFPCHQTCLSLKREA